MFAATNGNDISLFRRVFCSDARFSSPRFRPYTLAFLFASSPSSCLAPSFPYLPHPLPPALVSRARRARVRLANGAKDCQRLAAAGVSAK